MHGPCELITRDRCSVLRLGMWGLEPTPRLKHKKLLRYWAMEQ